MDGLNTSSNDSSKFSSGRFSLPSIIVVVVEIVPVEISSTISEATTVILQKNAT